MEMIIGIENLHCTCISVQEAFYEGEWGKMSARDRGALMFKYV